MMSEVLAACLRMFTHLCTTEKRALNSLTQAFRLLIVSVVFSYYCIVLMYYNVAYDTCLSEIILTNMNKTDVPCD